MGPPQGTHLNAGNVYRRVLKPAAAAAGVPWAGFHTLRHTCATRLFRRGASAVQVQRWLGHATPAFTLAKYVHVLPGDMPDGDIAAVPTVAVRVQVEPRLDPLTNATQSPSWG
jgi:integrase